MAKILEAKHLMLTQGKMRKRVLLTTNEMFLSVVGLSQPIYVSLDFTAQAAEPQPIQATGRSPMKAIYFRC
jgi:hypothetical protein